MRAYTLYTHCTRFIWFGVWINKVQDSYGKLLDVLSQEFETVFICKFLDHCECPWTCVSVDNILWTFKLNTKAEADDRIAVISTHLQGKCWWPFILAYVDRKALTQTIPEILQCVQNLQRNAGNKLQRHQNSILGLEKVLNHTDAQEWQSWKSKCNFLWNNSLWNVRNR